jgi:hypothetical protein
VGLEGLFELDLFGMAFLVEEFGLDTKEFLGLSRGTVGFTSFALTSREVKY